MQPAISALLISFLISLGAQASLAASRPAPEWDIAEWINGEGSSLTELRGKVVVIDFFQLWCPGCNSFSVPLMATWEKKYAQAVADGRLVFISIHSVFEGHDFQNPDRLRLYLQQKDVRHLVGVDRHRGGETIPETMQRYQTRGTPEVTIIYQQGLIRLQKFGRFDPAEGETLIENLLEEKGI
ncbi:MAG: TlpA disulfide reductase family protein [Gammaproteobacteria bacterium]|nr:TlpA disulfide reductase family protein [Gammaproteobacteria bacterium]